MKKSFAFIFLTAFISLAFVTDTQYPTKITPLRLEAKSVILVTYNAELKFDELVKGKRNDSTITIFNTAGGQVSYSAYGSSNYPLQYEDAAKFNNDGSIQERTIRGEGIDYQRTVHTYDQTKKLTESNDFDYYGKLLSKTKYKYNTKGQLFHFTEYYPDGARKSRTYCFYNERGLRVVEAKVDENNMLKEQHVMIHDSLSRVTRILTYDSYLFLVQTMDYFYWDTSDIESGLIIRVDPTDEPIWSDSAKYNDNGIISQPGCTFSFDENGLITSRTELYDDRTITNTYENAVLRSTEMKDDEGYTYLQIFDQLGQLSDFNIKKNGSVKMSAKYTYDASRALTAIEDPVTKTAAKISYDREGRIVIIKMYEGSTILDRSYHVSYNQEGHLESSSLDYVDPSATDSREDYKMYDSFKLVGSEPIWWMDGLMITKLNHKYTFSGDGVVLEDYQYSYGSTRWITHEYKTDSRGHWIYSLDSDKLTGKPLQIRERKIYYR